MIYSFWGVFTAFDQKFYDIDVNERIDSNNTTKQIVKIKSNTQQFQAFAQLKYKLSDKAVIIGGLHSNYLALNNSSAIEPRISYNQKIGKAHNISLAYGLNSQTLAIGSYYTKIYNPRGNYYEDNMNLKMIKSHHFVLAYDVIFLKNYNIKLEPYFQYIYDAPVSSDTSSTLYLLNERKGFAEEKMVSNGEGMNYGLDFSFEKYYTKNWFLMINASVFSSRYKTNNKWYSTHQDSRFGTSTIVGKEFIFKKNNSSIELGMRIQYSGGFRYTPTDSLASLIQKKIITIDGDDTYTKTLKNYFRPDLRIAYKQNKKKLSWSVSLDIVNFANYKNILRPFYDRETSALGFRYQSGLTPVLAFQIDFYKKTNNK